MVLKGSLTIINPMTIKRLIFICIMLLVSACTPRDEWATHLASDSGFADYAFDYPAHWSLEDGNNFISLVYPKSIRGNAPDTLKAGQIMVSMSLNINKSPEEMVTYRAETLTGLIEFNAVQSFDLEGRPAASMEGVNPETQDQTLLLALDMGQNTRALLSARVAPGELETWLETLLRIAGSLRFQ